MSLERVFDVAVIGGGIHGTGVARDCAMRRLSVVLFERNDLASGGSGKSSGLIHGGPHFLETSGETTRKSCDEIATLERLAPHLFTRVPVVIPAFRTDARGYLDKVESLISIYDRFSLKKGGKPHLRLSPAETRALEPGLAEDVTGAVTLDEWMIDPVRLILMTAKGAAAAGAEIVTRAKVENIEIQEGRVVGVTITRDGARKLVRARTVVNAAGVWAGLVDPRRTPSLRIRPVKSVCLELDRRISNTGIACRGIDGKEGILLMPRDRTTIIAGLEEDFYGNPDHAGVSHGEVGYLMQTAARAFPKIADYRFQRAFASVRASLPQWGTAPRDAGLGHAIIDHTADGAEGLVTLVGGKISTHRWSAEQAVDLVCKKLRRKERCRTHLESLPAATTEVPWREESSRTGVDPVTVRRLMARHGFKALEILEEARKTPALCRTLCECEQVLAAEVDYAVKEEWALSLTDVMRRTELGMGPCRACRCAGVAGLLMGSLLGWKSDRTEEEVRIASLERSAECAPVLFGEQARQEEYARALRHLSAGDEG